MSLVVTFNGKNLTKSFFLGELSRPLPEFRDVTTQIEGADGESFDGITVGVREVSFTLTAKAKTPRAVQNLARKLMSWFAVSTPKPLTFSDELDGEGIQLVRYAVPTGSFDAEEFIRAGRWTCRFKQPDPYLYGKVHESVILPAGASVKLATGGNATTYAVAKAKMPNSANSYTISNGKQSIEYAADFSGETVTVDFEKQTVRVSPSISGAPGLQVGSRFFGMRGDEQLTASHRTTLAWVERWL